MAAQFDLFLNLDLMVTNNQEVSLKLSTLCDMAEENILGAMFSFSSDNEKEENSKRESGFRFVSSHLDER